MISLKSFEAVVNCYLDYLKMELDISDSMRKIFPDSTLILGLPDKASESLRTVLISEKMDSEEGVDSFIEALDNHYIFGQEFEYSFTEKLKDGTQQKYTISSILDYYKYCNQELCGEVVTEGLLGVAQRATCVFDKNGIHIEEI